MFTCRCLTPALVEADQLGTFFRHAASGWRNFIAILTKINTRRRCPCLNSAPSCGGKMAKHGSESSTGADLRVLVCRESMAEGPVAFLSEHPGETPVRRQRGS